MIAVVAYYIYRRHFLRYRYTLTNDMLAIEQIGGKEEKILAAISLSDITQIQRSDDKHKRKGKIIRASLPPYKNAIKVITMIDEEAIPYEISASEEFSAKLIEQWKITR